MKHSAPQTVLITGASTGFGNLTTRRLLEEGFTVYATMRAPLGRNRTHAEALEKHAQEAAGNLTILDLDVTDAKSIETAVATVRDRAGQIDILINNAGQAYMGPFEAFSDSQLRQQFEVNFFGPAALIRAALPGMREAGNGLIVNVSSGLGRVVFPGTGVYSASKFALEAMSEAIRFETSAFGIDSVTVEPGAYATDIGGKMVDPELELENEPYGPREATAEQWRTSLGEYFETGGGDPQEVVTEILNLIRADHDKRPARVAVGGDVAFVTDLNDSALPHQRAGLQAFGMQALEHLVR